MVIGARDFDQAELFQMRVVELRIEKTVTLPPQACRQKDHGMLAGVAAQREHALAEKSAAQRQAVDAAHQLWRLVARPDLDAVGVAFAVQLRVAGDDLVIDPGIVARARDIAAVARTAAHDAFEVAIKGDDIGVPAQTLAQAARHVKGLERQDAALRRVVPADVLRAPARRHGKDAHRIGRAHQCWAQLHIVFVIVCVVAGHAPSSRKIARRSNPCSFSRSGLFGEDMHDVEFLAIAAGQHPAAQRMFEEKPVEMFDQHRPASAKAQAAQAEGQVAAPRFAQALRRQYNTVGRTLRRGAGAGIGWTAGRIENGFFVHMETPENPGWHFAPRFQDKVRPSGIPWFARFAAI